MMQPWDAIEAQFWPAMKLSGMLRTVRVKPSGKPVIDVDVVCSEPDSIRFDATISKDYSIEYQYTDLPTLAEGDPVTLLDADSMPLPKGKFRVRMAPMVTDNPADSQTGFFRRAVLTKL